MDKLRAKFHRHIGVRFAVRQDATAEAIARFEENHARPGADQVASGGESGRTAADDDDVGVRANLYCASSAWQAPSQRRHASAQTRQCSIFAACFSHSAPQLWHAWIQARSCAPASLKSVRVKREMI